MKYSGMQAMLPPALLATPTITMLKGSTAFRGPLRPPCPYTNGPKIPGKKDQKNLDRMSAMTRRHPCEGAPYRAFMGREPSSYVALRALRAAGRMPQAEFMRIYTEAGAAGLSDGSVGSFLNNFRHHERDEYWPRRFRDSKWNYEEELRGVPTIRPDGLLMPRETVQRMLRQLLIDDATQCIRVIRPKKEWVQPFGPVREIDEWVKTTEWERKCNPNAPTERLWTRRECIPGRYVTLERTGAPRNGNMLVWVGPNSAARQEFDALHANEQTVPEDVVGTSDEWMLDSPENEW